MSFYAEIRIELQLSAGVWTDVSADVLDGISGSSGIAGNGPLDRVASTGRLQFKLRNDAGCSGGVANYYTPGHTNCRSGFQTGIKARLVISHGAQDFTKFYGIVPANGISIDVNRFSNIVTVTVLDYMNQCALHEMDLPSLAEDKRLDEVVPLIVANMPIAPLSTDYNEGETTFSLVFDRVTSKTRALQEMGEAALSELGFVYVKPDTTSDEVLVVDGRYTRSEKTLDDIPVADENIFNLLLEYGGNLLLENNVSTGNIIVGGAGTSLTNGTYLVTGTMNGKVKYLKDTIYIYWVSAGGGFWIIGTIVPSVAYYYSSDDVATPDLVTTWETSPGVGSDPVPAVANYCSTSNSLALENLTNAAAAFTDLHKSIAVTHAADYYNQVKVKSYPRKIDAAATTVLFNLDYPIYIAAGNTVTLTGRFRDPDNETSNVAGTEMVTPAATTDYLFNSASDGTGSNLTADLTVTATYGVNGVDYTLVNGGVSNGYVTLLQARGKGIYTYNPVDKKYEYAAGIAIDGTKVLNLNMPYLDDPLIADDFGTILLQQYEQKRTLVEAVNFIANKSAFLKSAFVYRGVGDKVWLVDSYAGVDEEFFIQQVNFTIVQQVVEFTWLLKAASFDSYVFWELETTGLSELDVSTILGF